jgi:diguanylate cyclase (GGDEF)-like protein
MGDFAIKRTVELITKNLRSSDLMARFGGEEFCILLEDISLENTKKLFEKIRVCFEENKILNDNKEVNFTISIGVCYGLKENLEEMIKISDEELYKCKNNGRNMISIR